MKRKHTRLVGKKSLRGSGARRRQKKGVAVAKRTLRPSK